MSAVPGESRGRVVFAALMPHPPILIPAVGRKQLKSASGTVAGMRLAALRLNRRQPETVVVISPHSPRKPSHFGLWSDSRLSGSFSRFGAPLVGLEFLNDLALVAELEAQARRVGIRTWEINTQPLDHGALVPLWYLAEEGWRGPAAVLSLNYQGEGCLREFGRALHRAAIRLGRRIAVIASGDLSHRLTLDAPAGYEPRARDFDREFIVCLRQGAYRDLEKVNPKLRNVAGEDALDSTLVAVAAANWEATGHEVLSYEGPFGVGYGVAILFDLESAVPRLQGAPLPERCRKIWGEILPWVARQSLRAVLFETGEHLPTAQNDCLKAQRGVFVTINHASFGHRGCAGTLSPSCQNVVAETRRAACSAAFGDPRFPPVAWQEFSSLQLEVSVIEPMEEVTSKAQLDPERFGVVVSAADGRKA
ncbi:MAG TPA: class III extradiol ring-cleavage dioxygenase family protein, partial [Verrucomicrobiae bacterium]|nr:class III extradiol ring-cleavage dioxygenase family protein [Verrucomicrobiae bacterium]